MRYRAASGTSWSAYEYRDVAAELYQRILAAAPHGQQVIEEHVTPFHAFRRLGESTWHLPDSTERDGSMLTAALRGRGISRGTRP